MNCSKIIFLYKNINWSNLCLLLLKATDLNSVLFRSELFSPLFLIFRNTFCLLISLHYSVCLPMHYSSSFICTFLHLTSSLSFSLLASRLPSTPVEAQDVGYLQASLWKYAPLWGTSGFGCSRRWNAQRLE